MTHKDQVQGQKWSPNSPMLYNLSEGQYQQIRTKYIACATMYCVLYNLHWGRKDTVMMNRRCNDDDMHDALCHIQAFSYSEMININNVSLETGN